MEHLYLIWCDGVLDFLMVWHMAKMNYGACESFKLPAIHSAICLLCMCVCLCVCLLIGY